MGNNSGSFPNIYQPVPEGAILSSTNPDEVFYAFAILA
jgi:hypothetical protein